MGTDAYAPTTSSAETQSVSRTPIKRPTMRWLRGWLAGQFFKVHVYPERGERVPTMTSHSFRQIVIHWPDSKEADDE